MELVIDLADRAAIRRTYSDCQKWRSKGGVLRSAAPRDFKPFDPAELLPAQQWQSLLEVGCGLEGWIGSIVNKASPTATIYAYDISEDVLRFFSRDFASTVGGKLKHHSIIGDGEHLPFVDQSFDAASAVFVGHHMQDADCFIRGLARVLQPHGWLLTNALDWNFPPPDFPSQSLQRWFGKQARFEVHNAFDEASTRDALTAHFSDIREHHVAIPATLHSREELTKLHSRLEEFITPLLPAGCSWDNYLNCVSELVADYLRENEGYQFTLPITYFVAERPRR